MTAMTLTEISEATGIPVKTLQGRAKRLKIQYAGIRELPTGNLVRTYEMSPELTDSRAIRAEYAVEDAELLARDGVGTHEAARRIGYRSWGSLERALHRAGRHDIASRLRHNQTNN